MSLPELRAEDAKGNIKLIYQAIENALGVRLVNLVYRHLATVPGTLEWSWGVVGKPELLGRAKPVAKAGPLSPA